MAEEVKYIISLKDLFSAQIQNSIKQSKELNKSVQDTQFSIRGLASIATTAFAGIGIASFGKSVIDTGAQFEKFELGLKTFAGSAQAAHEEFEAIKAAAKATPFEVEPLFRGILALRSTGMSAKDAERDVLALGNAITGSGGGNDELQRMVINLQQIKNTGKATAMDIRQFGYAGINIYGLLSAATGKNKKELAEMDISYEVLTDALRKAGEAGGLYFGATENAMQSTAGQLSNLSDAFNFFKADLFNELQPAINSVISGLSSMFKIMMDGVRWIKENSREIKTLGVFVGALAGAWFVYNTAIRIATWYTGLNTAAIILNTLMTEGATAAMWALSIAMDANPVGLIIIGIAALAAGMYYLWTETENAIEVLRIIALVFPVVGVPLLLLGETIKFVKNNMVEIKEVFYGVISVIKAVGSAVYNLMEAFVKFHSLDFKGAGESLSKALEVDISGAYAKGKKGYTDTIEKEAGMVAMVAGSATSRSKSYKPTTGLGKSSMVDSSMSALKSDKVKGNQSKIITINIGSLINTQNVTAQNLKESAFKIKEEVAKALIGATNDVNIIYK